MHWMNRGSLLRGRGRSIHVEFSISVVVYLLFIGAPIVCGVLCLGLALLYTVKSVLSGNSKKTKQRS